LPLSLVLRSMRVSVVTCNGRVLAAPDADSSWRLHDVLAAVPAQGGALGCRRRIFLGPVELRGSSTLAEMGVESGSELTLVVTPPFRVVTLIRNLVKIWSAGSGECLPLLEGHRDVVLSAVFSPDGQEALTASADGTARLWSAGSGECLRTLEGHRDEVNSAVFSPDGQQVLTASNDGTAKLWSAGSGECLRTLEGHRDEVDSAVFSPDGQEALTSSNVDGTARLWSAGSGECLRTLRGRGGSFAPIAAPR